MGEMIVKGGTVGDEEEDDDEEEEEEEEDEEEEEEVVVVVIGEDVVIVEDEVEVDEGVSEVGEVGGGSPDGVGVVAGFSFCLPRRRICWVSVLR